MSQKFYFNTVNEILLKTLKKLMKAEEFNKFRLVGGTSLSLQRGHRISIDIDLFTDAEYDSIDFNKIDYFLNKTFSYVDCMKIEVISFGKSYFIGSSYSENIKLDVYYTDNFIQDAIITEGIRMASVEEIIAMKIDVISRSGRKKDFWDIHELTPEYSLVKMLDLHQKRYPYSHEREQIIQKFTDFEKADEDFDPICLKNKHWEIIKLDLMDFAAK